MKTYRDILIQELFDTKVNLKVLEDKTKDGRFAASFNIDTNEFAFDGRHVTWMAAGGEIPDGWEEGWDITFSRWHEGEWQFDVLGDMSAKDTLAVFSGVKKGLEMWVRSMKKNDLPLNFFFTSKSVEASRSKLYDKFAKIIARKLKLDGPVISKSGGKKYFAFKEK